MVSQHHLCPSGFQSLPNGERIFSCVINFDSSWLVVPNGKTGSITRNGQGRPIPGTIKRVERLVNERLIVDARAELVELAYKSIDTSRQSYIEYLKERHEAGMCVLAYLFPEILVGTYLSAFYVVPAQHLSTPYFDKDSKKNNLIFYPASMLPKEFFKKDELVDSKAFKYHLEDQDKNPKEFFRDRVAFETSSVTEKKLIRLTVDTAKNRKAKLLYLDNVTYAPGNTQYPSWNKTCTYLNKLREELYGEGIRLFINVAWNIGRQCDLKQELQDVELLVNAVEGITLESGQILYSGNSLESNSGLCRKNEEQLFRKDKNSIENNLKVFQKMLEKGLTVIFMPGEYLTEEATAAWALMLRKPGYRILVNKDVKTEIPSWISWPDKLGIPIDSVGTVSSKNNKDIVVSRKFENSTISLNLSTMTVNFAPKIF